MDAVLMAKKPAARRGVDADLMVPRTLKMRQEYADWLGRFAAHQRVSLSALIDRALAAHAAAVGFDAPPERTP